MNVLGTEYKINPKSGSNNDPKLADANGYVDYTTKQIVIDTDVFTHTDKTVERLDIYGEDLVMHELVHAYIYESGLDCSFNQEIIVEWIAKMIDRLYESKKEVKKLGLYKKYKKDKRQS